MATIYLYFMILSNVSKTEILFVVLCPRETIKVAFRLNNLI